MTVQQDTELFYFFLLVRMNGQPVATSMGVVVQAMVAADAAGVVFSRDPLTGDPTKVTVTANYGLGEASRIWANPIRFFFLNMFSLFHRAWSPPCPNLTRWW